MKITLVSCVFLPEPVISAQTSSHLAQELANKGFFIHVIAPFPNRPAGKIYNDYKRKVIQREKISNSINVTRCFSIFSRNSGMFSRFLENFSFGVFSGVVLLFSHRPDVIYSNNWPIIASCIISLVSAIKRIPLVISIQDIYPESLVVQKRVSSNSFLANLLRKIDKIISNSAYSIIVISKQFERVYVEDRNVSKEKIKVIPNWVNNTSFIGLSGKDIRKCHNINKDDFLLVFAGNIGTASGLELVINSMGVLQKSPKLKLLVAGDGSQLKNLQNYVQTREIKNVIFHSPWPVEETECVLKSADVFILPTAQNQAKVSVPSKLISYLRAARPVIALADDDTEIACVINDSGCGWVIPPGDPEALTKLIKKVESLETEELEKRAKLGQLYAQEYYSAQKNVEKVVDIIIEAGRHGR